MASRFKGHEIDRGICQFGLAWANDLFFWPSKGHEIDVIYDYWVVVGQWPYFDGISIQWQRWDGRCVGLLRVITFFFWASQSKGHKMDMEYFAYKVVMGQWPSFVDISIQRPWDWTWCICLKGCYMGLRTSFIHISIQRPWDWCGIRPLDLWVKLTFWSSSYYLTSPLE